MFLSKMTPDPEAKPDPATPPDPATSTTPDEWVVMLESSGVPSLYGENRAIFSATLTKQATVLLYQAFDGFIPAGVVYDLQFDGLQPAFHVHASVDWNQVYTYLKEVHKIDTLFFSSDVEKTVSNLIDNRVIKLDAAIEGVGDEGMEGQFNEVRKEITDLILDKFFKPTPNPYKPDTSTQDAIISTISAIRDLGSGFNVGYQLVELDATESRSIDIDFDVARAVERKIAPQAHLNLCFQDWNLTKDEVVTVVDASDDFFREAELSVQTSADYQGDGIAGVTVQVAYGQPTPPPANADLWSPPTFTKTDTVAKKRSWYDPAVGDQVQYRYDVVFTDNQEGPTNRLSHDWETSRGTVIMVTPDELYQRRELEFQLDADMPLDLYPEVEVELAYTDPTSSWSYHESTILSASARTWQPAFPINSGSDPTVSYKLTYLHGGGNLERDWQTTNDSHVIVGDPRGNLFTVHLIVAGQRDQINEIVVDLRYEDPDNSIFESKSFSIDKTTINQPHDWTFPRADPSRHRYTYSQVIVDGQGNVITTGEVQADDNVLLIGPTYAALWTIRPELVGPPLADNGVEQVKVELHYEGGANGAATDKEITFGGIGAGETWPLQLKDPSRRDYTYRVNYVLNSGFVRTAGPFASSDTFLVVSSVPPTQ
jgi:hypothetical protein